MRFAIALLIGLVPVHGIADDESDAKKAAELAKRIDDIRKPDLRLPPLPPPTPWPKNIRGRVEACKDGYVLLNLGIDAGL